MRKEVQAFSLDKELYQEFTKIVPNQYRSKTIESLIKQLLEEYKKSPEGVHSLRHEEENPQSIQDQEVI